MPSLVRAINLVAALLFCASLIGCTIAPKPLKPGRSVQTLNAGTTSRLELQQPENPATPTKQNFERKTETTLEIPRGSQITSKTATLDEKTGATNSVVESTITASAPTRQVTKTEERTGTEIGSAQRDTAREMGARLAAMRPVQWCGIVLILGALALCYFSWWTKAAIVGGSGIGMIVVAAVIPGHELLIMAVGSVVAVVGCFVVLYVYHKSAVDVLKKVGLFGEEKK